MERSINLIGSNRCERKFCISELTVPEVECVIRRHPAVFLEAHPERFVNSLYFDTVMLTDYVSSVEGLSRRSKTRIRWYGDLLGAIEEPYLEVKHKNGLVGRKQQFALIPFAFDYSFTLGGLQDVFLKSELPGGLRLRLAYLEPSILTRYRRKYFESANRRWRITLDWNVEAWRIWNRGNTFLHKIVDLVNTVVELKYDEAVDEEVRWIGDHLPFRATKSSKYVKGMEELWSWL